MAGEKGHPNLPTVAARHKNNYGFSQDDFDYTRLPDWDTNFVSDEDIAAFAQALCPPDPTHLASPDDDDSIRSPRSPSLPMASSFDGVTRRATSVASVDFGGQHSSSTEYLAHRDSNAENLFITAQNDWAPVHQKIPRRRKRRRPGIGGRTVDETREGYLYGLLKWPLLLVVGMWIIGLALSYLWTRFYIFSYEYFVAWRGTRERLRRNMRSASSYREWVGAAKELDTYLGNQRWKEENAFAYYDSKTVKRVWEQLRKYRHAAEQREAELMDGDSKSARARGGLGVDTEDRNKNKATHDLKALVEACVKNNFVGVENPRLYSQTYYGTKNLVQNFVDEVEKGTKFLVNTSQLSNEEKRSLFKRMHANFGRTALCLSGGAAFAYYHFGVIKALLEADQIPDVITGTSGGALVAALVATRTNDELEQLLVPALAHKITACREPISTWLPRWWRTGARFDSVDWARQMGWWSRGSTTFREAYERTGRILNVSCVPADPHSPTILCNYLTSPDCVIWSAVLASAAVPGIQNPVVLMMKNGDGSLSPYSFGHKWKDGSLRTDIPIKALNLHFNVNFTIVSQVNPHISLFFFSSRGTVGSPVTHRKGRGWRGGYLGSATEQYIKLDLNKWLKVLKHLELLPRPLGQDWSQLWLQQFGGTITIWPKSVPSDFLNILSDPNPATLARMIHEGQQSAFPKLKFIANRLKVERLVEEGRRETRGNMRRGSIETILSEDDMRSLLRGSTPTDEDSATDVDEQELDEEVIIEDGDFENAVDPPPDKAEKLVPSIEGDEELQDRLKEE
ncbi:lipase [Microdochium bolleyi]|uniref:Patatin-like phospholipase domain-containing protein n=1 Tax=Microdochium bolleyi TaxID=196109 RepID=A0A136JB36_9PEZI|nr:lipase [Microdochium bolleyi]